MLACGKNGHRRNGCNGGYPNSYLEWITKDRNGYDKTEAQYPYQQHKNGITKPCKDISGSVNKTYVVDSNY